jgi:hypothetical protein
LSSSRGRKDNLFSETISNVVIQICIDKEAVAPFVQIGSARNFAYEEEVIFASESCNERKLKDGWIG